MADTRRDKRTAVALKVRFKSATVDEFIEQYSTDLSRGGIFVKSGRPMKIGTLLKFQFQLKDESTLIRGVGRVVWTREDDSDPESPPGMGIKFIKMDDASKQTLEQVLGRGDEAKKSRFDVGPGLGKGETESPTAHPSDPPEGSFFPSTSREEDLPPPEDRTNVRHASEFLAGALSGVEDEDAAREAAATAEQARKRSEEIDAERARAHKGAEPSILVDPTLESERPAAPDEGDEGQVEDDAPKKRDPERDIDTEVGSKDQLERLAQERAERKEAARKSQDLLLEAERAKEDAAGAAAEAATVQTSEESGGNKGLLIAVVLAAVLLLGYLATRGGDATPKAAQMPPETAAAVEPEPSAPQPEAVEPAAALEDEAPEAEEEPEDEAVDEAEDEAAEEDEAVEEEEAEAEDDGEAEGAQASDEGDEEAAEGAAVRVRLVTVPAGAELTVDGEPAGTAPTVVELAQGVPVEVRAKLPGRAEVVEEFAPSTKAAQRLRLVLPRLRYLLSVVSTPEGATALGGGSRIETPGELDLGIPQTGSVRVRVRAPGHVQATRVVYVGQFEERDGAMRQTLEVELQERAPIQGGPARAKPRPDADGQEDAEDEAEAPAPTEAPTPEPAPAKEPTPAPTPTPTPPPTPDAPTPAPAPTPDAPTPPPTPPPDAPTPAPAPTPDAPTPPPTPPPDAPAPAP